MKIQYRITPLFLFLTILFYSSPAVPADDTVIASRIVSVKLFQNQAEITRVVRISLSKGENIVTLGGLPPALLDWSVKGRLPKDYPGRILSIEVEKKALVKKRQNRIAEIEKKLEDLREKDMVHLDELKGIKSQQDFLDSILQFAHQTASRELATRLPQIQVWDDTLQYVSAKRKGLFARKREIEKLREQLGKEIQKWEFELSQIAGYNYFSTYQSLNKSTLENRAAMNIQQFASSTEKYAERYRLLREPTEGVEIEKRLIIQINSGSAQEADFSFSYLIPDTFWRMQYDVRASREHGSIDLIVFANIFQKTGEDWNKIRLHLSTGSPVNAIRPPLLAPWFLDLVPVYQPGYGDINLRKEAMGGKQRYEKKDMGKSVEEMDQVQEAEVKEKGPYFEIGLPMELSILSSNKYQNKLIREFKLKDDGRVTFYYELVPAQVPTGFLKVRLTNTTPLPWLTGDAQIFFENEFVGKGVMPYTPGGKEETLILGLEPRITARKELVKKFEDTSGIFGASRRILYSYKITIENQLPSNTDVMVLDSMPVSRNEKIQAEIKNLSHPFHKDAVWEKSTEYAQGLRKWKMSLETHQKKEITYDLIVSCDKEVRIQGLR